MRIKRRGKMGIMMSSPIVTMLTDFGSLYPAQMKGVILSLSPRAVLVDIAHDIPPQGVLAGAFALWAAVRYFPPGTVHLAVVDPEVGTERLGLVMESGGHMFVGPDNGLLMPAARSMGNPRAYCLSVPGDASKTFHGRDVFAPAAAQLAEGEEPSRLGTAVTPRDLIFPQPRRTDKGLEVTVLYVDRFGNAVIGLESLPDHALSLRGVPLRRLQTYALAEGIEPLITVGSHGMGEIAVNRGSAASMFDLSPGDRITLEE